MDVNSRDMLIILKKDEWETWESIIDQNAYFLWKYTPQGVEMTHTFSLRDYWDGLCYSGRHCEVCSTFADKINYVAAGLYNDDLLLSTLKEISHGYITDINIPSVRYTGQYYIKEWMEKYNLSLKDLLLNKKYVIISDTDGPLNRFDKLNELGLIDWKNIEAFSLEDEYEEA